MSVPTPKAKVEKAIASLPASLRRRVNAVFHSKKFFRHGSEDSVTDEDKKLMAICYHAGRAPGQWSKAEEAGEFGMPFRPLETAFKLHPASGNDAQRCVNKGMEFIKRDGLPEYWKTVEKECEAMRKEIARQKEAAKAAEKAAKEAKRKKTLAAA